MKTLLLIAFILTIALAPDQQTRAQKVLPGDVTEITLETGDGFCYHCGRATTLRADGTAVYHGDKNSHYRAGDFTGAIEKTEFARLAQTVVEAGFLDFKPRYEGTFDDVASVVITVVYAGGSKTVENFGRSQEPKLKLIEQAFNAVIGAIKWQKAAAKIEDKPAKRLALFAHLAEDHAAAVIKYVSAHKYLRPAIVADGENQEGLGLMREVYGAKYHPYYAVYDFDRDKIQDFAVVLFDAEAKPDAHFFLVVFKGAADKTFNPVFTGSKMDLGLGGIEIEPLGNKTNLRVVHFQTDQGCSVLQLRKGQLVLSECPTEKS